MALVRALNNAISGLRAHQLRMDVVGDNLANANTVGFKSGRVEFSTLLSQTISFGTAPQGNLGGIDPQQFGLGVQVGDTSHNFAQGGLEATGIPSDLAIDGDGFFILEDESGETVFSRDGSFSINPQNFLHDPSTGFIVQGVMADENTFQIPDLGPLVGLEIKVGELTIARATTEAVFDGNFNTAGELSKNGTVLDSEQFVDLTAAGVYNGNDAAVLNTLLTDLGRFGPSGTNVDLNLTLGDIINVGATKGGRTLPTLSFAISATPVVGTDGFGTTVGELVTFMRQTFGINNSAGADSFSANITSGTVAAADTFTLTTYTAPGVDFPALGVEVGDWFRTITGGDRAGQNVQIAVVAVGSLTFVGAGLDPTVPLPIAGDQWDINEQSRVAIGIDDPATAGLEGYITDQAREDRNVLEGVIRIAGNIGTSNALDNLTFSSNGVTLATFTEQAEADGESVISVATVFDSLGEPHPVEITYALAASSDRGNVVRWYAEAVDNLGAERVVGSGFIMFDPSGNVLTESPTPSFSVDLSNTGAVTPLSVTVDHSGVTGFFDDSEIAMVEQDGFAEGTLSDFSVAADGIINGIFTNGQVRTLGRVVLSRFANNNGLLAQGSSFYRVGPNSGTAVNLIPGTFGAGQIRGGFLEESNVDIAKQFTDLIVSQRSFQANTRVIRASDEMLQDLINVV